eukprot:1138959-Pelagomonas_calceolata.AAC.1
MLGSCSFKGGRGVGIRTEFRFNKVNVPGFRRNLIGSTWVDRLGMERTKTASGQLWCWAGESVHYGKKTIRDRLGDFSRERKKRQERKNQW